MFGGKADNGWTRVVTAQVFTNTQQILRSLRLSYNIVMSSVFVYVLRMFNANDSKG